VLTAARTDGIWTIDGSVDFAAGLVSGTWDDGQGSFGILEGSGCALN